MKVLFVSAVLPYPLHSGGAVRLYNLLKLLSKVHEITLYSFIRNESERKYVEDLSFIKTVKLYYRGYVWQPKYILRSLTSSLPLLMTSYEHNEMKREIEQDVKKSHYDLIHCEPFYVYPSIPQDVKCPIVVAEHNIEYEVYQSYVHQFPVSFIRPFLYLDVHKIQKQEEFAWKKARCIIAVSDHDASVIRCKVGEKKVTIIPNGVDTTYFSFEKKSFNKKHPTFLFVGNFLWMPNMTAVERLIREIWPKIVQTVPHAHLLIVGKHLSQKLQKEAEAQHSIYKEYVEDIRDLYKSSDILLAPMTISGGTKFKMLEAMVSGCFVITTKEGMEGIDVQNGIHYLEADSASDYVSAIQNVYNDPLKSQEMTLKARSVIEKSYDWRLQAGKLSSVWEESV